MEKLASAVLKLRWLIISIVLLLTAFLIMLVKLKRFWAGQQEGSNQD